VVLSAVLPQFTVEVETKFAPLTVRVKLEPPGAAETGEMLVMKGTGLFVAPALGTHKPKTMTTRAPKNILPLACRSFFMSLLSLRTGPYAHTRAPDCYAVKECEFGFGATANALPA
jgi:hypothetical protein